MLQAHFREMAAQTDHLFVVDVDKDYIWNLYLDSFPVGTNEIFRRRREHDCSCCRHFMKDFGNVVMIKDNVITTLWDFQVGDAIYQPVVNALSAYIKSKAVIDVYVGKLNKIGTDYNFEEIDGKAHQWDHLYFELPAKFIDRSSESVGELQGEARAIHDVLEGSLTKISVDSLETVLDLISQNSLYKGEEWKNQLTMFLKLKKTYDGLDSEEAKKNFVWEQSVKVGPVVGKIKNHSIGTLLIDISEGTDLDRAVKTYENIVAGPNYKRPKPIYSQKMLDAAKEDLRKDGYLESLLRRYARLDDITINNILFSNKDAAKRIKGAADVFDAMSNDIGINSKKFSKVEEIGIADFISKVLPTATELEVYLENKHAPNMVSLIAPENMSAKTMFKWNNGFSWAYTGNITDSDMKDRVKAAGGKVDGDLRFTIQWNDTAEYSPNDLDAHCKEPSGEEIYFCHARKPEFSWTKGQLDVDITSPLKGVPAVENITWANRKTMTPGKYLFFVRQFANRGGKDGFRAEIEFNGQVYSYDYSRELRHKQDIAVAEVTLDENGKFTIKELLPSSVSSKDIWNLKTNQFIPVSVVMYSPNYWDEQNGIGHRHYFFMLKDCINPESPNGFYNEFLKEDMMKHKHVLEALGSKMAVKAVDDQLSGLGFSATKRNELIVKVKGTSERVLKIKF
jgi:hypothetical protein